MSRSHRLDWPRAALLALAALAAAASGGPAFAQASASDFTSGYRYDAARRLVGRIDPDPDGAGPLRYAAVRYSYNPAGQLTNTESGELANWQADNVAPAAWTGFTIFRSTATAYDTVARKASETSTSGGTAMAATQYGYDSSGRLECTTVRMNTAAFASLPAACALGAQGSFGPDRITRHVYDVAGRLTTVQRAYRITTANGFPATLQQDYVGYEYTDNGRQKAVVDANGNRAEMRYDGHDRQSCWIFPSKVTAGALGGDCVTGDFESYGYDPNGNRTTLRKRDGSTLTYQYDALNRMTVKIVPERAGLDPVHSRDVYYDYDLRGLQTKARFDSLAGEGITNVYDGFGRLVSSSSNMAGVTRTVGYLYDLNGNRVRITHPDNSYFAYEHDGLDRLKLVRENGGDPIATIAYDTAGRRASSGQAAVTAYAYDPVGRLQTLTHELAGTSRDHVLGFTYNPASQIHTRSASNDAYAWGGALNTSRPYAVNGLNQYSYAGAATFGYDPNGNLASTANAPWSTAYVYDVENRLVAASGTQVAELVYDPLGRLVQVSSGGAGIRRLVYDGDALVAEYDSAGTMVHRYIHGNDPDADDPLVWYDNLASGWRRALLTDHQGSVIQVADIYGNPIATNSYDPWGIPGVQTGRFGYTGQAWVPELGLWYYKARFYSPTLGRFLQIDPIGYDDQINLYAYVGNDPLNQIDSTGARGDPARHIIPETRARTEPKSGFSAIPPWLRKIVGPIAVAATIRGAMERFLPQPRRTVFAYRVYGGSADQKGAYWTQQHPDSYATKQDARAALALDPAWGNTMERVVTVAIDGTNIVEEGVAAPVTTADGKVLPGGASEVRVRDPAAVRVLEDKPYKKPEKAP